MRRVGLMAMMSLALLGPAPVSATVICAGDWPRMTGGQAWRCTGPDWLVGTSAEPTPYVSNRIVLFQEEAGQVSEPNPTAPSMTGWQRAGVYGLEFGGAAAGTAVAAMAALGMYRTGQQPEYLVLGIAALPVYAVSSGLLSATGAHLVAMGIGERRPYGRALLGGALGGVAGAAALLVYATQLNRHDELAALGLALPPICAVAVYNIWRNSDSK